ncbi:MAG: TerB family tellurite resistance protein [Lachnospiraceae bacterium]|nr:TerB family tellurite resistance protein [Ruminococcus sp.]MCM1275381.1 TerB family tellurite resistance protein [Lachnospiraceae bacterium]
MYLGKLNDEQKNLFLDLCIHGANSNNDFADDEKEMVDAYCAEMQIPVRYVEETDFNACVDRLIAISSAEELRAVLIELTAIILADDICDDMEEAFMQEFIKKAGIPDSEYRHISQTLAELSTIYKKLNNYVAKG